MILIGLAIGMAVGTALTLILMEVYVKSKLKALEKHQVVKGSNGFSVELLPCPHCGANNEIIKEHNIEGERYISIECGKCGSSTAPFKNPTDAILIWIARAIGSEKFN